MGAWYSAIAGPGKKRKCSYDSDEDECRPAAKRRNITSKGFSDLSPEIVLRIFSYIPQKDLLLNVACVCKKWNKLIMDSELWHSLKLDGRKVTSKKAVQMVSGMTQLKQLELVHWWDESVENILDAVGNTAPKLERLHLKYMSSLNDGMMERIVQKCCYIRDIYLLSLHGPRRHPFDTLSSLSHLEKLTLIGDTDSEPPDGSVARKWLGLKEVKLQPHFPSHNDAELQILINSVGCHLQKLTARYLEDPVSYACLSKCQNLQELYLQCGEDMSDADFLSGVGSLTNLRALAVRGHHLTAETLMVYLSQQRLVGRIEILDLSQTPILNDSHLSAIASNCPRLVNLSLKKCCNITRQGLLDLVKNAQQLKLIFLKWCYQLGDVNEVTDQLKQVRPHICLDFYS